MDPQACFESFCYAVKGGDLDIASECEGAYQEWRKRGGHSATYEEDPVLSLDNEQDRFLKGEGITGERWVML